uniref:Cyanophycin synthase-like N-terminal domain-containing protein n=1 Tax=Solibacter usitatus (strain Ellin6076) TaxID=234267 RepID=Q01RC6_SOLUE
MTPAAARLGLWTPIEVFLYCWWPLAADLEQAALLPCPKQIKTHDGGIYENPTDTNHRKESYEIPGFVDRILAALPGLHEHHCGKGYAGGFVERLREGTWFGHIVEHVCLELTDRAGIPVNRGKTVEAGAEGIFYVAVEYRSEAGMRRLLEISVDYVEALIAGRPYRLEEGIAEVIDIVARFELGPSTRAIIDAAVGSLGFQVTMPIWLRTAGQ